MIVLVGGQSRKVGKTTAVCQIIAATVDAMWIAFKVTPHSHDPGSSLDPDTERYLRAGAAEAHLIPGVLPPVAVGRNVIVESNRAIAQVSPDLVVYVADPAKADVKASAAAVEMRAQFRLDAPVSVCNELIAEVRRLLASGPRS